MPLRMVREAELRAARGAVDAVDAAIVRLLKLRRAAVRWARRSRGRGRDRARELIVLRRYGSDRQVGLAVLKACR